MRQRLIAMVLGLALLPLTGWTISRIGGGKVQSLQSGFTADLSLYFQEIKVPNEDFQLFSSPISGLGPIAQPIASTLILAEISDAYKIPTGLDRENTELVFQDLQYQDRTAEFALDPCITVFHRGGADTNQYVVIWGENRGFELSLARNAFTLTTGEKFVRSVELKEGACGWN